MTTVWAITLSAVPAVLGVWLGWQDDRRRREQGPWLPESRRQWRER